MKELLLSLFSHFFAIFWKLYFIIIANNIKFVLFSASGPWLQWYMLMLYLLLQLGVSLLFYHWAPWQQHHENTCEHIELLASAHLLLQFPGGSEEEYEMVLKKTKKKKTSSCAVHIYICMELDYFACLCIFVSPLTQSSNTVLSHNFNDGCHFLAWLQEDVSRQSRACSPSRGGPRGKMTRLLPPSKCSLMFTHFCMPQPPAHLLSSTCCNRPSKGSK